MKKSIILLAISIFLTGSIMAQQGQGKKQQRKIVVENTLKAYFNAINSNDQVKWESMVDLSTLGWGTRDSLPWLKDPNMPGIISPRDAASGLATGKRQHKPVIASATHPGIAVEPTTWIRDSMFLKLRMNDFTFDDIESMTIRKGLSWGTKDSLPWFKLFIVLKPGNTVKARVAGDEFRGLSDTDLHNKNTRRFIAPDLLPVLHEDPSAISRMLSLRMQRKPDGFVIVLSDNPDLILAPPPGKQGGRKQ